MRDNIGLYRGKPKNKGDYYFFSQNWTESCKDGFVYGSLVIAHNKYYICVTALCAINSCVNNGMTSMIEVIPETIGEYTGLTDKNGKKIFEGDILYDEYNESNCLITFDEGSFCIIDDDVSQSVWGCSMNGLEIIGNIHDNPELLRNEQE
jgi:hypothetical protein